MVEGRTGAESCTEIFLQLGGVIPQLVFAYTQMLPTTPLWMDENGHLTVMELLPCPLKRVVPDGTDHKYVLAPGILTTLYVIICSSIARKAMNMLMGKNSTAPIPNSSNSATNTKYKYILVQSCDVFFCQDDLKKSLHSLSLRNYFFKKYWWKRTSR